MVVTASDALPLVAIYDSPLKAILHRFYGLNDRQDQGRVEVPSIQLRAQITTLGALQKRVAARGDRYEEAALMPLAWAGGGGTRGSEALVLAVEEVDIDSGSSHIRSSDIMHLPVKVVEESEYLLDEGGNEAINPDVSSYSMRFKPPTSVGEDSRQCRLFEEALALHVEILCPGTPFSPSKGTSKTPAHVRDEKDADADNLPKGLTQMLASMAPGAIGSNKIEVAIRVEALLPSLVLNLVPVASVPLLETPLVNALRQQQVHNFTGITSMKTGFLSMHETRRAVLLLESDTTAMAKLPLIGIWVTGIGNLSSSVTMANEGVDAPLNHPLVWAAAIRFLFSKHVPQRFFTDEIDSDRMQSNCTATASDFEIESTATAPVKTFLLAWFPDNRNCNSFGTSAEPRFFECSCPIPDTKIAHSRAAAKELYCPFRKFNFMADVRINNVDKHIFYEDPNDNDSFYPGHLSLVGRLKPAPYAQLPFIPASLILPQKEGSAAFKCNETIEKYSFSSLAKTVSSSASECPSPPSPPIQQLLEIDVKSLQQDSLPDDCKAVTMAIEEGVDDNISSKCGQKLTAQSLLILQQQAQLNELKRQVAELRAICYGARSTSDDDSLKLLDCEEKHHNHLQPKTTALEDSNTSETVESEQRSDTGIGKDVNFKKCIAVSTEDGKESHDETVRNEDVPLLQIHSSCHASLDAPPPCYDDVIGMDNSKEAKYVMSKDKEVIQDCNQKDAGMPVLADCEIRHIESQEGSAIEEKRHQDVSSKDTYDMKDNTPASVTPVAAEADTVLEGHNKESEANCENPTIDEVLNAPSISGVLNTSVTDFIARKAKDTEVYGQQMHLDETKCLNRGGQLLVSAGQHLTAINLSISESMSVESFVEALEVPQIQCLDDSIMLTGDECTQSMQEFYRLPGVQAEVLDEGFYEETNSVISIMEKYTKK